MVRNWIRLLVLALVPVLIVSAPNVVQAETLYSNPPAEATVTSSAEASPGGQVSCTVVTYWVQDSSGSTPSLPASTSCSTGFNINSALVSFDLNGGGCNFHMNIGQVDGQPNPHRWAFTTSGGYDGATCEVTELCMNYQLSLHSWFSNPSGTDCVAIDLGKPPVSEDLSGTCQALTVGRPQMAAPVTGTSGTSKGWKQQTTIAAVPGTDPGHTFFVYALVRSNGNGSLSSGTWNTGSGGTSNMTATSPAQGQQLRYHYHNVTWADLVSGSHKRDFGVSPWWSTGPGAGPQGEVIGVGIIGQMAGTITNTMRYYSETTQGRLGVTLPGSCTFYWGERVDNVADFEGDNPIGPLTGVAPGTGSPTPPEVTDPDGPPPASSTGCDFSFSDPTTWAGGGICALVELISSLLNMIGDVLDFLWGLVEALGNMIKDLFVPSDGFMEEQAEAMGDAWGDTPPAVFIDSAQDVGESVMVSSPGGGCTGPAWTFNKPGPLGGGTATVHPFEACEAPMSTLATIVRTGLTVGVYLGAFLVALRIVAAAFGVQLNIGRGQEDTA